MVGFGGAILDTTFYWAENFTIPGAMAITDSDGNNKINNKTMEDTTRDKINSFGGGGIAKLGVLGVVPGNPGQISDNLFVK